MTFSTMSSMLHTCILILLIVSVNGNWEKIGERIYNKIKSGLEHSIKNVKVCGLPKILQPPENMTLNSGDTAKFLCTVDMTCMVSYVEWYKHTDNESVELLRKGTDPGDPYSYTISDVDTEDTGLYSCVAGNILGETVHVAHLQVNFSNKLVNKCVIVMMMMNTGLQFYRWWLLGLRFGDIL